MGLKNRLTKDFFLPTLDLVSKGDISRQFNFLQKSQWYNEAQLSQIQNIKLRKLVNHSYRNVPYYHKLFRSLDLYPDSIKKVDDLRKLDFLTKDHINNNFTSLTSKNIEPGSYITASSGGTTGNTLTYLQSKKSVDFRRAANLRGLGWAGYNIGDNYVDLWSNPRHINASKTDYGRIIDKFRSRDLLNFYNIDKETMLNNYIPFIKKKKPKFIRGYSSAIFVLAKMIDEGEIEVDGVFTTAENLTEEMRNTIENKLGCRVFDGYSGEGGAHANECHTHTGYHCHPEGAITEFIDSKGDIVSGGEKGEIVVTDLNNYAMPFFRYRIQDLAIPSSDYCTCGKKLPFVEKILGRVSDIIVTPNGKILTRPSFFGSSRIKALVGLREYQVVQEKLDVVKIKVIVDQTFNTDSEKSLLDMAIDILGPDVSVSIEKVDFIPTAESGKRKVIISKVKNPFSL